MYIVYVHGKIFVKGFYRLLMYIRTYIHTVHMYIMYIHTYNLLMVTLNHKLSTIIVDNFKTVKTLSGIFLLLYQRIFSPKPVTYVRMYIHSMVIYMICTTKT